MRKPEETNILELVTGFASNHLAPNVAAWSSDSSTKSKLYKDAAELGVFGLEIPVLSGGLGLPFSIKAKVCEKLAATDFGFAMSLINTHNVGVRLIKSASPELQAKYLPQLLAGKMSACTALTEPSAGSDFAAISCRATKMDKGWTLSGEKTWIVNARHAGLAVVFAQCGAQKGSDQIGAFLIDLNAVGITRYPIDTEFSQASMGTGGFVLDSVYINDDHILIPPGTAFKEILKEINGARIYVAAMCVGMLENALEQVNAYGDERETFGKPLSEQPSWKCVLDDVKADLRVVRLLLLEAIEQYELGLDAQLLAARSKIKAVEICQYHLPRLLHAMGAEGLKSKYCFSRHIAATQIAGLTDGATSMLKARVQKMTAANTK